MRILFLGDVVGQTGCNAIKLNLAKIIKEKTGMITRTTGMIKDLNHANKILKNNLYLPL